MTTTKAPQFRTFAEWVKFANDRREAGASEEDIRAEIAPYYRGILSDTVDRIMSADPDELKKKAEKKEAARLKAGEYVIVRGPKTYEYRKELRGMGLRWHPESKSWRGRIADDARDIDCSRVTTHCDVTRGTTSSPTQNWYVETKHGRELHHDY
jgi:hypothetical protein